MKQPFAGIVVTAAVIAISLALISLFTFPVFSGWVAWGLVCVIPMQVVIAVGWGCRHPAFAATRKQPLKGFLLILITVAAGLVVGYAYFVSIGGGIGPPTPMLAQCTIVSVVVMFWLAIIWGGWPFTALLRNPIASGLAMLAACYIVNAILFRVFFNYEFMKDAPVYVASLDPHGLFHAWSATVFYVTSLSIMFLMIHFDLWPLSRAKGLLKQPVLGLVWTVIALGGGAALFTLGTQWVGMDPVRFLVRVPIPFIFGTIVVLNMLQNSLFSRLTQPLKGVANAAAAAILGTALARFYGALAGVVTGALTAGPPSYDAEIWLASALLSVTFPFLIYSAEFLRFWPLEVKQ